MNKPDKTVTQIVKKRSILRKTAGYIVGIIMFLGGAYLFYKGQTSAGVTLGLAGLGSLGFTQLNSQEMSDIYSFVDALNAKLNGPK